MATADTMNANDPSHLRTDATVLHYTGYDHDRGGIVAAIKNLVQAGRGRALLGVKPGFVATAPSNLAVLTLPAIEGEMISPINFWRARKVAMAVRDWLRADAARVFHGHSRAGLLVALWLTWLGERRVVVTVHCYGRQRWFYRWAARELGDRLFWLTPAMKRYYGIADATTWEQCMPNCLPARGVNGLADKLTSDVLKLGGAGALVRWKRWDLVLRALALLPAGARVEFTHIGGAIDTAESRDCERQLHELTRELGLTNRVRWLGWQESSAELLRTVDVVVVPSDGEPFSMIALEALFAGKPVIATRGGGPEDILTHGQNGWLVPAGDAEALARAFENCLHPTAWAQLRFAPEQLTRFSPRVAEEWASIYARR